MAALVFPPDFFFCSGSAGTTGGGEIVSARGMTDVDGVSLRDAAGPARAVGSAFAEASSFAEATEDRPADKSADTSTAGGGTSNVPAEFDGGGVCD